MPQINSAGLKLIKDFEGLRLKSYDDGTGVWTIGWGHTGPEVRPGQIITSQRADQLLLSDLQGAEKEVNTVVARNCTPNQFAALVSFEFNTGSLADSTVLRRFNEGDLAAAADQFLRWNHAGGKVLPGLTRRRQAERALFLSDAP